MARLFRSGYWPREVPLVIETGAVRKDLTFTELGSGYRRGGDPRYRGPESRKREEKAPVTRPADRRSHQGRDPPRTDLEEKLSRLERTLDQVRGQMLALEQSAGDALRMLATRNERHLLRPLLLFLVDRGVLGRDEVEIFLGESNPDSLLRRIRGALQRLRTHRDALEVQRYVAEVTLKSQVPAAR